MFEYGLAHLIELYYFREHKDLLNHYKTKHIICEEGECLHLGIAFRTDTELKLHKVNFFSYIVPKFYI